MRSTSVAMPCARSTAANWAGHASCWARAPDLAAHWQDEETGLFRVMAREELFAEHIAPLIRQHRELGELLATVDILEPEGQQAIRDAVFDLYGHISKEEDGLFPVSPTSPAATSGTRRWTRGMGRTRAGA